MATWITPKISWLPTDYINYTDYNRIKGDVEYLLGAVSSSNSVDYPYSLSVYNYSYNYTIRANATFTLPAIDCRWSPKSNKRLYMPFGVRTVIRTNSGRRLWYQETDRNGLMTNWAYRNGGSDLPVTVTLLIFQWGVTSLPELYDMGSDKAVNDLWYADEFNTILDNIDLIAEIIGQNYDSRPFYYPNGHTPTALELQGIERKIQLLYNRIGRLDNLYLGSGYLGSRMSNRIL